jgi:hypothetical protein
MGLYFMANGGLGGRFHLWFRYQAILWWMSNSQQLQQTRARQSKSIE